jgi:hypothetical protein
MRADMAGVVGDCCPLRLASGLSFLTLRADLVLETENCKGYILALVSFTAELTRPRDTR